MELVIGASNWGWSQQWGRVKNGMESVIEGRVSDGVESVMGWS